MAVKIKGRRVSIEGSATREMPGELIDRNRYNAVLNTHQKKVKMLISFRCIQEAGIIFTI